MTQRDDSYSGDVAVGQVWQHKRESWRRVTIRAIYRDGEAFVDRNTSRRKQSIRFTTLRREYRMVQG